MAHGLGGTREMRLDEYAERFAAAGYACFLFDYRNFGASDGNKRQLINVRMQLEDWESAIEHVKKTIALMERVFCSLALHSAAAM